MKDVSRSCSHGFGPTTELQFAKRGSIRGSIQRPCDAATGETTWCSGAAALIRRKAFDEVGEFDERLYFMYCEDVDLSWKLWLQGWKCIYLSDAAVRHFTQDLLPGKKRTQENYFSFRNSLFLFYRFGTKQDRPLMWDFLLRRFLSQVVFSAK